MLFRSQDDIAVALARAAMIASGKRDPLQRSVGEARAGLRRVARSRPGAERVADMNDGHVDEIEQRSVRASFSQSAGFSQFLGDLDQAIGFRHGIVLLS